MMAGGGGAEGALPMRAKEALARIPGQQVGSCCSTPPPPRNRPAPLPPPYPPPGRNV